MSTNRKFTYAVIGGGIAGVTCAEHLEIVDGERSVALISGTDIVKAVINVMHLTKSVDIFDVEGKHHTFLEEQCSSVTVIPAFVKAIRTKEKELHLGTGEVIQYEKLCVCTGATPKILFPGHPLVLFIRDTESAAAFQRRLSNASRIVIIGNGGIATEMVYQISGVEVIWAVKDAWFTAAFIDPGTAEFFRPELTKDKVTDDCKISKRKKYSIDCRKTTECSKDNLALGGALGPDWHEGLQMTGNVAKEHLYRRRIVLETEVEVIALHSPEEVAKDQTLFQKLVANDGESCWPVYVELSNGKLYGCNFVVSAIGVTPNTELLTDGRFKFAKDGGVCVGEDLQTDVADIYAAGDVCTPSWPWASHWHQIRLWTQARQMGSYAAKCMWASITGEKIYQDFCFELFTHATKFFGFKVVMLGLYNGQKLDGKYDILLRMTRGVEYIKVILKDCKMQGAILVGETDLEETFENLILNQMDLSNYGEDLLNPDIDIEDYFD